MKTFPGGKRERETPPLIYRGGVPAIPEHGIPKMNSPILPHHPLDQPGLVKIALGQSASDALAALGDFQLVLVSKADCIAPQSAQGRRILHCLPITKGLADAAFQVVTGTHRAVKIKQVPSPAAPLTPAEIRGA